MNERIKILFRKIVLHIPILERRVRIKERPYIIIRKYKKEIKSFFKNIIDSQKVFHEKKRVDNLIISLTSFPERIDLFEYTLFSLINQTIRPKKIVLWLSREEFNKKKKAMPKNLAKYQNFNFEIAFINKNCRSYKKLAYAIKEYKNDLIVTADDDLYYPPDWLELLVNYHYDFPGDIIAHRIHNITFKDTIIDSYKNWKGQNKDVSFLNFPTTGGGVLYPPGSLYCDAVKDELFLKLCPFADDIWFYVMALLQKTRIRRITHGYQHCINFDYDLKLSSKKGTRLWEINRTNNDIQLKNVLDYYNLYVSFYELFNDN
jgi:hypothetical protein